MIDFNQLSPNITLCTKSSDKHHADAIQTLWHNFHQNMSLIDDPVNLFAQISVDDWQDFYHTWQTLKNDINAEMALTDWLIRLFDALFNNPKLEQMPTRLVRGTGEPEYFPTDGSHASRIEFAHGFFQSALHEISHWCVAGKKRRLLNDFGYWYEADGRNEQTQAIFEQVEITPQAIECLLSLALGRFFYVSQDNLNADFDTTQSTFAQDVYAKSMGYLKQPHALPRDARRLLWVFLTLGHTPFYQSPKISEPA